MSRGQRQRREREDAAEEGIPVLGNGIGKALLGEWDLQAWGLGPRDASPEPTLTAALQSEQRPGRRKWGSMCSSGCQGPAASRTGAHSRLMAVSPHLALHIQESGLWGAGFGGPKKTTVLGVGGKVYQRGDPSMSKLSDGDRHYEQKALFLKDNVKPCLQNKGENC